MEHRKFKRRVTELVGSEFKTSCCLHCRADVSRVRQRLCEAYDHIDLPPIRPDVTRVMLFGGDCPRCTARFKATPPADMPPGLAVRGEAANLGDLLALHARHHLRAAGPAAA